MSKFWYHLVSN